MNNYEKILATDGGVFKSFIDSMSSLLDSTSSEREILMKGRGYLANLVSNDQWLPDQCAQSYVDRYAQHLLYKDPENRFSVVSFVWGPGQKTPVHDHTVWGLVGVIRGSELCDEYCLVDGAPQPQGKSHVLKKGQVEAVSPTIGDWHQVANHVDDQPSISIHVYGGDIGAIRRHMLSPDGKVVDFVSGYSTI